MDGNHFDEIARSASARGSRRGVLAALAGGLLTALAPTVDAKQKRGKKPKRGKGWGQGGSPPRDSGPCTDRCGGRCWSRCPDVMRRNRRTCACECPDGMTKCGKSCLAGNRCCPGEKACGGGCIREQDCCPHTHKTCLDGTCLPKGGGVCCPGVEEPCAATGECCNSSVGETCTVDGCCNELAGFAICGGRCVDTGTEANCGGCGNACGPCEVCRRVGPETFCDAPNSDPPRCETCANGRVERGQACGNRCCGAGAECCGNGCCAAGNCRDQNGQSCCLKIEDNRPVCKVL